MPQLSGAVIPKLDESYRFYFQLNVSIIIIIAIICGFQKPWSI